jgi:hypothetical protein
MFWVGESSTRKIIAISLSNLFVLIRLRALSETEKHAASPSNPFSFNLALDDAKCNKKITTEKLDLSFTPEREISRNICWSHVRTALDGLYGAFMIANIFSTNYESYDSRII